ncbi:MAG: RES domain-containing protein, partial [Thaumarchaeota archaeon]|nr:RES domain-containing protein [Nitrososphaerota archaeon]
MIKSGTAQQCSNCGRLRLAITLEELGNIVDKAFKHFYEPGGDVPEYDPESEHTTWTQEGSPAADIIAELIDGDYEIAEAVVEMMAAKDGFAVVKDGATSYYDDTSHYIRTSPYTHMHFSLWLTFRDRVKHERRFFDPNGKELLDEIFDNIQDFSYGGTPKPTVVLDPVKGKVQFRRARRASDAGMAKRFMKEPWSEVGPPPSKSARAGRMNAVGIPVFYGAFEAETCVAELRPPVGSILVYALFEPLKELKLLDLTMFQQEPSNIDPFDESQYENLSRWRFLDSFHNQITTPIQPEEEEVEYLPTQVVAEYVRSILGYDGIIYSSAQAKEPRRNIVLFDARIRLPNGSWPEEDRTWADDIGAEEAGIHLEHPKRLGLTYVAGTARIVKVTGTTYYKWRKEYGGLQVDQAKRY